MNVKRLSALNKNAAVEYKRCIQVNNKSRLLQNVAFTPLYERYILVLVK